MEGLYRTGEVSPGRGHGRNTWGRPHFCLNRSLANAGYEVKMNSRASWALKGTLIEGSILSLKEAMGPVCWQLGAALKPGGLWAGVQGRCAAG